MEWKVISERPLYQTSGSASASRLTARMPLLHLREQLSSIAHIGDSGGEAQRLRRTLAPFYPR
jgi:hypothetical protein